MNDIKNMIISSKLSYEQKELLRIFLAGENYFIPYTLDGNWHFADSMKVIDKFEFIDALLEGNWYFDVSGCDLDDKVYMLEIYLKDEETKSKILAPYKKFKDHYLKEDIESNIVLYVTYSYILKIYSNKLLNSNIWDKLIYKEDL